jgi:hypothetical protein
MPELQKMLRDAMPAFVPGRAADAAAAVGSRMPTAAAVRVTQQGRLATDEEN